MWLLVPADTIVEDVKIFHGDFVAVRVYGIMVNILLQKRHF